MPKTSTNPWGNLQAQLAGMYGGNPHRIDQEDTRSDLESELESMIDRSVNFPEWTTAEDRIQEYTDVFGDVRYDVDGIQDYKWGLPTMESAQQHLMDNYWDPNEIDLPKVIQELKGMRSIDTGGIPKYLQGLDPEEYYVPYEDFNPMDSSTWRIPAPEKDHRGNLQETIKYQSPEDSAFYMRDESGINGRRTNLLDYYAQQGNPELRRGSSTGFFPTKNYPEAAINQLQGMVDNNQLVGKYSSRISAGKYDTGTGETSIEKGTIDDDNYNYGSPGNRYRKENGFLNEVLAHEAIHKDADQDEGILRKVPYPLNAYYKDYDNLDSWDRATRTTNPFASSRDRQAAELHPAMHYIDNQFYNNSWDVDINRKGLENVNAMYNANDNSPFVSPKDRGFSGVPADKFGAQQEANQWARDAGDMRQPTNRGGRPNMADVAGPRPRTGRGPSRAQQRLNAGGLASLML